jgi:hypothetical protein
MFVSFYTILKQRLKIFWSSTPTNFSYEPPLLVTINAIFYTTQKTLKFYKKVNFFFHNGEENLLQLKLQSCYITAVSEKREEQRLDSLLFFWLAVLISYKYICYHLLER